jgi:hypothetical protein
LHADTALATATTPAFIAPPSDLSVRTAPNASIVTHCQSLADQRTSDAALNGLEEGLQQTIHDRTYSECVAWQTKHGAPD